jgi:murein DD-endopeptidase MepM/ murein hydrolase activator NlpD
MPQLHTPLHRRWQPLAVFAAAVLALPAPAAAQTHLAMLAVAPPPRAASADPGDELRARHLLIPVQGISAAQLHDTYNESRSGGRVHDAIDIHAPRGTPVLAVADGTIRKLHSGERGGNSLYQVDDDGRTRYYYAHMDHYADGMTEGRRVRRGDVIGYVGDTGNAQPGDYHLHFSIAILDNPSRWWTGMNLNPYDILAPRGTRLASGR